MDWGHSVQSEAELDRLYGTPSAAAIVKEIDHVSDHYRAFIERSPFVVVATVGPEGLDCSPRGDPAGFVRIADRKTVMLPDRRGNNRIDALRNLVRDPRISLLFLIPGVGETLRVNGRAAISADPALCQGFEMEGKAPRTVIVVSVERVYFQCRKALARSRLWEPSSRIDRASLPSAGEILEALTRGEVDAEAYEAAYPERMRQSMY
jgi:hypothetical protein